MNRFRKKPIMIEAEQFFLDKKPWPVGVVEGMATKYRYLGCTDAQAAYSVNDPRNILEVGKEYDVWSVTVHGWHTDVVLTDYKRMCFNSVCFKRVELVSADKGRTNRGVGMSATLDDYPDEYDCPICGATNEGGDDCICDDPAIPCDCKYCYCQDDTIAGGMCDNCSRGIHQG